MKPRARAFTLVELLVVIAVLGILAALLLPALSLVKRKAGQSMCLNNQKQLGMGVLMYLDEHNATFPGWASQHAGFNSSDWIYWRTNLAYPQVEKSPIASTLANVTRKLFRCPLDLDDSQRLQEASSDPVSGPYLYSYSMTSYNLDGELNPGMTTICKGNRFYPFRQPSIQMPASKIMLAEEVASACQDNPTRAKVINDGRWSPAENDPLTARHEGKAVVSFADGHAQAVPWEFGSDTNNSAALR
jgi:prepilin-type N-terminal cleavage/methylation domain-containing protein/prepilin-type processing-associated H-X9-DG protein